MTVVVRVGLVDLVELVEVVEVVKVGVPIGTIWIGVAVARTGVGVRRKVGVRNVGVSRSNCSMASF